MKSQGDRNEMAQGRVPAVILVVNSNSAARVSLISGRKHSNHLSLLGRRTAAVTSVGVALYRHTQHRQWAPAGLSLP